MNKILIVISPLFLSLTSNAEIGTFANPPEKPVITIENGKPAVVTWKDGREAITVKYAYENLVVDVPTVLYENSCNGYIASKCAIRPAARAYVVGMAWTKHPASSRVGKSVIIKVNENQKYPLRLTQAFFAAVDHVRYPRASSDVPDDYIFCDDFKFLPHDPFAQPYNRILRWENEAMMENPETGGMENRSVGGALDVDLIPLSDKSRLRVQVQGGYISNFGFIFLVQGDIIGWTLRDNKQQLCQIGMKPNFSIFVNKAMEYLNSIPHKYNPYDIESDEFSTQIQKQMKQVFNNPNISVE